MSLIHEALKKAEEKRRLGEPPSLSTPFLARRRQSPLLPLLGAAIVASLIVGWWLSRGGSGVPGPVTAASQEQAPAKPAQPAATATTGAAQTSAAEVAPSTAATRRPSMGANASPNANLVTSLAAPAVVRNQAAPVSSPPSVKETAERESEPHPDGANPLAPGESAPLILGEEVASAVTNDPAGLASKQAVKEQQSAVANPTPGAAVPTPVAPANTATGGKSAATPTPAPTPPTAKAPPTIAGVPVTPHTPGGVATATEQLPLYWQLPYNLRKELPELTLSMHVYSATPAQRFVVLNGNRQVEGDDLGPDVKLSEIRTDGVVLQFRGQRFLVPRGGS